MDKTLMTCALNGIGLYDLDSAKDRIYIQDIEENTTIKAEADTRLYYGQTFLGQNAHNLLTVTVTFMIKERDRAERMALIQKINGWATKGYFTSNTHSNQRLYVICTQLPAVKTFLWNEEMKIVFTAYGEACWEDLAPVSYMVASSKTAASSTFTPGGTRVCFLEAEITNVASSALTTVTLTANGESISLTGLSVAKNQKVELFYDENHYLHITANGISVLNERTCADDLLLNPNTANSVSCSTNVNCKTIFKARGLYR